MPRTLPTESAGLQGCAIRARSASRQSRSPGPETQQPVRNKAGLAWRCLCPSSTRQDTWMDTQPGSGQGTTPTRPAPEKQTQHRGPVLRPQRAGSAQRLGPHPLTSHQNPTLRPQHRSVTQQLPKTLKSPRGPPGPLARRQCPAESRGGALGTSGACHMTVLKKNKLSGSSWCTDVNLLLETRMNSQLSEWRGHTLVLLLCHPGRLGQPSGGTPLEGPPAPGAPLGASGLQQHPQGVRACALPALSPHVLPFLTDSYQLLHRQTGHRQLPGRGS